MPPAYVRTSDVTPWLCECNINKSTTERHPKFQRIQNMAAKVIPYRKKCESSSESLLELHWLPIHRYIQYKVLTLVYKCMNGLASNYLINLITIHPNNQSLRSDNIYQRLIIPWTKRKMFAERSFSVMGPILWNQLPNFLKQSSMADQFKKRP